ncbi:MAG: tetratricopeptide repeat protein [Candidatus Thorarchaeota archaeon]|nr:tetratricopeptide repeat protein [Candidatus Thorarchaeota archaeon]
MTPEDDLKEALDLFGRREYKKAAKAAEKAQKKFEKDGLHARAIEAQRVMADSLLNARDLKEASRVYESMLKTSQARSMVSYQAAACWGLGEIAAFGMDYAKAVSHFKLGLDLARKIADKWYTAWNGFGLGKAYRGTGKLTEAREVLTEARDLFREQNQSVYAGWVEHLLGEIGGEVSSRKGEAKIWLCPMCGSKYPAETAQRLSAGKMVTCEYCGTTVG